MEKVCGRDIVSGRDDDDDKKKRKETSSFKAKGNKRKLFCVILSVKHFYRMGLKLFKCTKENKINYK